MTRRCVDRNRCAATARFKKVALSYLRCTVFRGLLKWLLVQYSDKNRE